MFAPMQGIIFSGFWLQVILQSCQFSSIFDCIARDLCTLYVVGRFLLLWKFVCSFILPLFYLIIPPSACTQILFACSRVCSRPTFIEHTRLCINNTVHCSRAHILCLLIISHYFSSCSEMCVGFFLSLSLPLPPSIHSIPLSSLFRLMFCWFPTWVLQNFAYCFPHFRIKVCCCIFVRVQRTRYSVASLPSLYHHHFTRFFHSTVWCCRFSFVHLNSGMNVASSSSNFHSFLMGICTWRISAYINTITIES